MASKYQEKQRSKQIELINNSQIFKGTKGGGKYKGLSREFVLNEPTNNIYPPIKDELIEYVKANNIAWWGGKTPSGHTLSSQIACFNHLFAVRLDKNAVLAILNNVKNEFTDVLPIPYDKEEAYIGFEMVSGEDYLNEKYSTRGSNCTSIDAFIYARHNNGELWLIPIEWKYTEFYNNQDKSTEDRPGINNKGLNGKGEERLSRYTSIMNDSKQLKSLSEYRKSSYYQEPFYQLMRQTLWAEQVIAHKTSEKELLKADNFLHIHIIPKENTDLLEKIYKVSSKMMEETWRECLTDQSKYHIIAPKDFLSPLANSHQELVKYLQTRYW